MDVDRKKHGVWGSKTVVSQVETVTRETGCEDPHRRGHDV